METNVHCLLASFFFATAVSTSNRIDLQNFINSVGIFMFLYLLLIASLIPSPVQRAAVIPRHTHTKQLKKSKKKLLASLGFIYISFIVLN